jgi:hypothetical protein
LPCSGSFLARENVRTKVWFRHETLQIADLPKPEDLGYPLPALLILAQFPRQVPVTAWNSEQRDWGARLPMTQNVNKLCQRLNHFHALRLE